MSTPTGLGALSSLGWASAMRVATLRGWFDARLLMWTTLVVLASGLPLLVGYDPTGASTRLGWSFVRPLLRSVHAASSFLLVVGVIVHLVARILRHKATRRAIRSGAAGVFALGLAAVSGAMMVRSADSEALRTAMGLDEVAEAAVLVAAVFHVAYSALVVMLALYWHVGRMGRDRVFGGWRRAALATGIGVAAGALVAGTQAGGHPATWALAPPVAGFWSWTLVGSVLLALLAAPMAKPPTKDPSAKSG